MIEMKLYAGLELKSTLGQRTNSIESRAGLTLAGAIDSLGIPRGAVAIAMVDGRQATLDAELRDGDRVALFPPIGGG